MAKSKNSIKSKFHFNKYHALALILLFSGLGAYFIYSSFAATRATTRTFTWTAADSEVKSDYYRKSNRFVDSKGRTILEVAESGRNNGSLPGIFVDFEGKTPAKFGNVCWYVNYVDRYERPVNLSELKNRYHLGFDTLLDGDKSDTFAHLDMIEDRHSNQTGYDKYCMFLKGDRKYKGASIVESSGSADNIANEKLDRNGYKLRFLKVVMNDKVMFKPGKDMSRLDMAVWLRAAISQSEYGDISDNGNKLCNTNSARGPFKDVSPENPFKPGFNGCYAIAWLKDEGITNGYGDGTYRPNNRVTRQAAAAMLFRAYDDGSFKSETCGSGKAGPFKDVPNNHTFCKEIEWMKKTGISKGYGDGTFRPANAVSRQAGAIFIHRAEGSPSSNVNRQLYSDVKPTSNFYEPIQWISGKYLPHQVSSSYLTN